MSKKLLIVDDDQDFLEATKIVLETNGFDVVWAVNGDRGYELAKSEKPDLMLLDVMMTYDSEGFDLARKLKNDTTTEKIPIIVITSISKAQRFEPNEDWLPAKKILEKPVKLPELLSAISDALK